MVHISGSFLLCKKTIQSEICKTVYHQRTTLTSNLLANENAHDCGAKVLEKCMPIIEMLCAQNMQG